MNLKFYEGFTPAHTLGNHQVPAQGGIFENTYRKTRLNNKSK